MDPSHWDKKIRTIKKLQNRLNFFLFDFHQGNNARYVIFLDVEEPETVSTNTEKRRTVKKIPDD